MTKHSLQKVSLAALGGAATLMILVSASVPANASTGSSKFRASPEELRRHCWRIDETYWKTKRRYGCGEVGRCTEGACVKTKIVKLPPPPPPPQPPTAQREPGKNGDGGNGGARAGGNGNGGKKGGGGSSNGGGSSSAAGGPN